MLKSNSPNWNQPDLSLVNGKTSPAPAFPRHVLGSGWDKWCAETAEAANAPYDYVAVSTITTAAALIGNARTVAFGEWNEPSIIWSVLIGSPSAKKSPAMASIKRHVTALEAELANVAEDDGFKPQIRIADVTARAAQEVVADNQKGALLNLDELSGWWAQIGRSGGEQFWLEAFGGAAYTVNRKGQKPLQIAHNSISVLGTAQPDPIRDLLEAKTDRGFTSRFLYIYPDQTSGFTRPKRVDQTAAVVALRRLRDLRLDDGGPVACDLTPEAEDEAHAWLEAHQAETARADGMWQQWNGKQDGMLLRYALVFEHLWWAMSSGAEVDLDGPLFVGADALKASADFVTTYAKPMAARSFNMAARPAEERWAAFLARRLQQAGAEVFNAREVRRNALGPIGQLAHAANMEAACGVLEAAHLIRKVGKRAGPTKGRSPETYEVNPALLAR